MKSKVQIIIPVLFLMSLLVLWGCPKKAEVSTSPESEQAPQVAPAKEEAKPEQKAEEKVEPAKEAAKPEAPKEESKERAAAASAGLQPIYFDFDKSFIRDDARPVMKANAEWLKANPKVKVRIEGNCDERGTKEYNQALGQRRASSAKKYLTDLGISAKRISLISYGKEKPICSEHNEDCWQKNRRDDLVAITE
jgi:peptidoglycan-associated lipoprotein